MLDIGQCTTWIDYNRIVYRQAFYYLPYPFMKQAARPLAIFPTQTKHQFDSFQMPITVERV